MRNLNTFGLSFPLAFLKWSIKSMTSFSLDTSSSVNSTLKSKYSPNLMLECSTCKEKSAIFTGLNPSNFSAP